MAKVNKVIIVFLAFSFLLMYGAWRFIHSKEFSEKASKRVSEILTKKAGARLVFEGVDFALFPPSTVFKKVKITKNDPALLDLDIAMEEIRVSFTYASFFSSDLEINELFLNNGSIVLKLAETKTPDIKWEELSIASEFDKYRKLLQSLPLRLNALHVKNARLQVDNIKTTIESFLVNPSSREIKLKSTLAEFQAEEFFQKKQALALDSIELDLQCNRNRIKVNQLSASNLSNKAELKGIFFNRGKFLEQDTTLALSLDLESLFKLIPPIPKDFSTLSAQITGAVKLNGALLDPEIDSKLNLHQVKSPWIELATSEIEIKKRKSNLFVNKLEARNELEFYQLVRPFVFFDLKKKSFMKPKISMMLKEAYTNTFLYSLKSTLSDLKATLSGPVEINWSGDNILFELKEKVSLKNFKLTNPSSKTPILQNNGFTLENSTLTLQKNLDLLVDLKLAMANTFLKVNGAITSKGINLVARDSRLDMQAFGPISGVKLTGSGVTNAEIKGPYEDVNFTFLVDWNNFSVVDLHFGRVKAGFNFSLKDLQVSIDKLDGIFNQSLFEAQGTLDFSDRSGMDLRLNFEKTNFADAQKMYALVFKQVTLPVIPEFNFQATYRVSGGYALDELKIDGKLKATDLKIAGEEAEKMNFNFSLNNNLLSFRDVKINKSRGEINANVLVNLQNNYTELEGNLSGLRLRDFQLYKKLNLSYDGDIVVDFDGNGIKENFSSRFKTRVTNTFIENIPASPSSAIVYLTPEEVVVNASLLSGKVKLDSQINLKTNVMSLRSNVESNDMREFLGVVAAHNINDKAISGRVKAALSSQLLLKPFEVKKFSLNIDQFNLRKNEIDLRVDPAYRSVSIEQGLVKSWDLRFRDGLNYFVSKAYNGPGGSIVYDQTFSVRSSFMEFLSSAVEKAEGNIKGVAQLIVDKKISISRFEVTGVKNSLKLKNLPGSISNLDFFMNKKGEIFELVSLTGKYGEGDVWAKGTFYFDDLFPQINLDYKIERSTIPLFKRTSILASSSGTISGSDLPYKLNGKITLQHGEVFDDPSDFTKEQKVNLDNIKKYLPEKNLIDNRGILTLNMTFETTNPITVKNNLTEVYVKGSGQLMGDLFNPEVNARLEVVPTASKFKFKGHDFSLNQGYLEIRDRGRTRNSDMKFVGLSKINDYDVKVDISGSLEKTNINLSSEPALAQEDLLSLLTLGVTSDISKNLEASERKSVTTVGIGALLFEQLKINEDLNSMLGLKLSVMPEFKEDESTLIQGKSAVSEGSSSRLKSATKIKINKQVTKQVDVSVSSTVGGSIEQTQEMNINYNINKKFSIEGVYEVKPSEDENTNTPNSIGADIKYRWSF